MKAVIIDTLPLQGAVVTSRDGTEILSLYLQQTRSQHMGNRMSESNHTVQYSRIGNLECLYDPQHRDPHW